MSSRPGAHLVEKAVALWSSSSAEGPRWLLWAVTGVARACGPTKPAEAILRTLESPAMSPSMRLHGHSHMRMRFTRPCLLAMPAAALLTPTMCLVRSYTPAASALSQLTDRRRRGQRSHTRPSTRSAILCRDADHGSTCGRQGWLAAACDKGHDLNTISGMRIKRTGDHNQDRAHPILHDAAGKEQSTAQPCYDRSSASAPCQSR